eukprot:20436-Heterococcus_DN1.PRE.1
MMCNVYACELQSTSHTKTPVLLKSLTRKSSNRNVLKRTARNAGFVTRQLLCCNSPTSNGQISASTIALMCTLGPSHK